MAVHRSPDRHGRGRDAATAAGAVIGAAVGSTAGAASWRLCRGAAARIHRCSVARRVTTSQWEERTDGYRVTYVYNGRRQVTELPYRPGDRIRVRVDVSPARVMTRVVCNGDVGGPLHESTAHIAFLANR